jgi:two-component system phosphate regulon sensor histidine kinase PhoR
VTPEIAFVVLLSVLLAIATMVALRRGEVLYRLREALGASTDPDLEPALRRLGGARDDAEWRASQREADLAYLADLISVGIVRLDDELTIELANHAAHAFLGAQPGSLPGRRVIEAFGDHRVEALVEQARQKGGAAGEVIIHGPPEVSLVVRARRSPTGGLWTVLEDVTELRRLQRIRAEFIDNLSHELRTPLTTVRLLTETLARDLDETPVPERIREGIEKIDVESGHLVQMVNELLDLAKVEQGPTRLYLDDVDLGEVVRATLERIRLFADRQGVSLGVEVPGDLPTVRGDEERLGQLLINLLHNAVKFSPGGGEVVVRARRTGEEVVVAVVDQGVGIPRAELPRIFERFYKVDKARIRGTGGTGLGLSIARHIAEAHGGRVWVESTEGAGSTFSFALPVAGV